jgi:hypothetical protein
VHKMRLPVVVRLDRSFSGNVHNDTTSEKLQFVISQLTNTVLGFTEAYKKNRQSGAVSPHYNCRTLNEMTR